MRASTLSATRRVVVLRCTLPGRRQPEDVGDLFQRPNRRADQSFGLSNRIIVFNSPFLGVGGAFWAAEQVRGAARDAPEGSPPTPTAR